MNIKKSLQTLANGNKLSTKKCVICTSYMLNKKHKYCTNKCARKAEKRLAKLRRLGI